MATTSSRPAPPPNPLDLDITIISAKHLKNVNWRNGDLNPYATVWLHPDHRLSTKTAVSPSTKPVWNEHFTLPLPSSLRDPLLLTLEIFHFKPSDTPKPLVGTARVKLSELLLGNSDGSARIHSLQLVRPSGRPQGKVLVKIALRERPPPPPPPPPSPPLYKDYNFPPQSGYYYSSAPPPLPSHPPAVNIQDYSREYSPSAYAAPHPPPPSLHLPVTAAPYSYVGYSPDGYSGYCNYSNYHSRQLLPPPGAFPGYGSSASSGPSAPVDYSYDQRLNAGGVGSVTGALGVFSLEERMAKYEEEEKKNEGDRVDSDAAAGTGREKFSDYHGKR